MNENLHFVHRTLLSPKQIHTILSGPVKWAKQASSRRTIPKLWTGVDNIQLKDFKFVQLEDGRIDINLPQDLTQSWLSDKIHQILSNLPHGFKIVHSNLLITPPNSDLQNWHQDNGGVDWNNYFTLLIPLNHAPGMGQTEIIQPYTYDFPKKKDQYQIVQPKLKIGDGLLFSGCLWHRGTPNLSNQTRYCLYLIISNQPENQLFENWS